MSVYGAMDFINALLSREQWQIGAPCGSSDFEAFFPQKGESTKPAKLICAGCDVQVQCLEYAMKHNERGIWGGTSERERRDLRRRMA